MSLAPGARLGPYEILSAVGAGGMGEVYKARDTRLDRTVALKILPSPDPVRRQRFEREARAIAALSHPHICTLHDVGQQDGIDFLVMEYLEGQTLAERLKKGALPLDEALQFATEISEGLDAAHRRGIVHRDLKPSNIMLTEGGAKLLDFGIATSRESNVSNDATTASRTARTLTGEGVLIGTLQYMSPEQLEGRKADVRSDLFAFGAVLYEMLTGRRAFDGQTDSRVIAAVLDSQPPPVAAGPPALQHLVKRCLAKDPDERWQTMHDVRLQLQWIADSGPVSSGGVVPSSTDGERRPKRAWRVGLVGLVVATLLGAFFYQAWRNHRAAVPAEYTQPEPGTPLLTRLTHDAGLQTDPTFSPDGRFIGYASNRAGNFDIWVQPVAGGDAVQVTNHPARDTQPDWSPDGSRIIFRSERDGGGLFVVPPFGGVEERVSTFGFRPIWSPDGSRFLFRTNVLGEGLGRVYVGTASGTEPLEISQFMPGGITTAAVNWHPNGKQVSFLQAGRAFALETLDLERRTVVRSEMSPSTSAAVDDLELGVARGQRFAWQPEGDALVFSGVANEVYDLWRVPVDPRTLAFLREPHRLTASPEHATQVAVSRDGRRVAYASTRANSVLWRYALNGTGGRLTDAAPQPLTSPEMNAFWPRVTPDRKRLFYFIERPGGRPHVHDLRSRSLTDGTDSFVRRYDLSLSMFRSRPIESWDGARSALLEGDRKTTTLRLIDRRTGAETRLTSPIPGVFLDRPTLCGWTPDSRFVVAAVSDGSASSVRLFPLAAAPRAELQARIVAESPGSRVRLQCGDVSAAGWIALLELQVTSATTISIKVVSTDGGEPVAITGSGWAHHPAWSPEGSTLYFYRADQGVVNLWAAGFDPQRGVRLGELYPLTKLDGTAEEFSVHCCAQQIGVTQEALILPIRHPTGGIWMLEMPPERD